MDTPPTPPVRPGRTLGLGILAHVDAGKTSLTERLLLHAGVIAELGSVDDGSTQTDTLALERARGITIKAAVVSFELGAADDPVTVNLVDTPGHSDFIAEVERSLAVLDGAVLVVSAVEGVQAQTRVLMRALRRLRIPTVLFVNKVDRSGARTDAVLQEVVDRLGVTPVPSAGSSTRARAAPRSSRTASRPWAWRRCGPAEREGARPGHRGSPRARRRGAEPGGRPPARGLGRRPAPGRRRVGCEQPSATRRSEVSCAPSSSARR